MSINFDPNISYEGVTNESNPKQLILNTKTKHQKDDEDEVKERSKKGQRDLKLKHSAVT